MGWGDVDWIGVSGGLSPGGERQGEVGDTWDEGRLDKGKWGSQSSQAWGEGRGGWGYMKWGRWMGKGI